MPPPPGGCLDQADLELHILVQDGEPRFAGMDIIQALGFEAAARAYSRLDTNEQTNVPRAHLGLKPGRPLKFVSESGLYKLIMRSDKPEARKFQDWVTRDVLPPIRKTSGYLLNGEAPDTARADDRTGMPLPWP